VGAEAECVLRVDGDRHVGRALLETDQLLFRGGDGYRLKLPFASARNPRAQNGSLLIDGPTSTIALELGAKAERWAEKISNPPSLLDKLDVKVTHAVALIGAKDPDFQKQLSARAASVTSGRIPKAANVVFLWSNAPAALAKLKGLADRIARDGAIWVIHPKGPASRVKDTDVFAAAKRAGLTATKVARFSDTHTAEKLVIPVARR